MQTITTIGVDSVPRVPRVPIAPPAETPDHYAATCALGRAHVRYHQRRAEYEAAETALALVLAAERPLIGNGALTDSELVGARLALRALDREVEIAQHHPRRRYAVRETVAGVGRIAEAREVVRRATVALDDAARVLAEAKAAATPVAEVA